MIKEKVHAGGRLVLVATDQKTQTVNIYSRAEVDGEYEYVVRMPSPDYFIVPRGLAQLDLDRPEPLVDHLVSQGGKLERGRKPPYLR